MTILCIETSTSVCSAAICKDGVLNKQCINYEGSNHARLLPLYIEQLLQYARENNLTIEAVALSKGPGSYTGLRIGTSTAKGLCYGLNVPLIPVPTLDVLCEAAREKLYTIHRTPYTLLPMLDARRMEVYTSINGETKAVVVENEDSFGIINLSAERSVSPEDGLCSVSEAVYYFGDGASKCTKLFTKPNWHYIPDIVPEAQFVGALAEQISNLQSQMSNAKSVDLAYYEPFYLKEFIAAQSHVKGLK